jgi:hypothetical protein
MKIKSKAKEKNTSIPSSLPVFFFFFSFRETKVPDRGRVLTTLRFQMQVVGCRVTKLAHFLE